MKTEELLTYVFQVLIVADGLLLVHGVIKRRRWEVIAALIPPAAVVLFFAWIFGSMIRAGF